MVQRCPADCITCSDKRCAQYYKKHFTCSDHPLHIGDNVQQISTSKNGFVYDANPYGSKRSVLVKFNDNTLLLLMGHKACLDLTKTGGRRKEGFSVK